jgi:hypothetical protein
MTSPTPYIAHRETDFKKILSNTPQPLEMLMGEVESGVPL